MLLVEDSSVLLKARCHCTSGVGMCGRMWSGQYILSLYLQCMLLCISYNVRSCTSCGSFFESTFLKIIILITNRLHYAVGRR